jgi:hypothetical protein
MKRQRDVVAQAAGQVANVKSTPLATPSLTT